MSSKQLLHTLQLVDSFFPVGSFAYSDGLETAATSQLLRDGKGLAGWLQHYIDAVFEPCDGPALLRCIHAVEQEDWESVRSIDEELTALKPSASARASSRSVGKRLLATYSGLVPRDAFIERTEKLPQSNAVVVYALVFAHRGVAASDALLAFGYARLAGMVSASLRLIPLGQLEGQSLLAAALDRLCETVERVLRSETAPLRSFGPLLDIQQMNHRYVYSRLFRS